MLIMSLILNILNETYFIIIFILYNPLQYKRKKNKTKNIKYK